MREGGLEGKEKEDVERDNAWQSNWEDDDQGDSEDKKYRMA